MAAVAELAPAPRAGWRVRRSPVRRVDLRGPALAVLAAIGGGWAIVSARPLALLLALLPLVLWLLVRPALTAVAFGASLPLVTSVAGTKLGLNVAISDLLLVLLTAGILLSATLRVSVPTVRSLRPVAVPVLQYAAILLVLVPLHLAPFELVKTAQRFELFLLPLLVGAFVALRGNHVRVLQAYVLATTAIAAVWPFYSLGMQKNPTGQMVADAILLLVGVRSLRRLLPCLPVLVAGLLLTQSRGAIVATAVGIAAIAAVSQPGRSRLLATRGLPLVVVALAAFVLMPASVRDRVTTFSSSPGASGAYALQIRQRYSQDAKRIVAAHPWTGIGVGNYLAGDASAGTEARDPHQVLLLEAAEGGYGFAASFVVLVVGAAFALRRLARRVDVAPAAVAVLLATAAHGLVDVYWVRGTPVLGWLLAGMACGCARSFADRETT